MKLIFTLISLLVSSAQNFFVWHVISEQYYTKQHDGYNATEGVVFILNQIWLSQLFILLWKNEAFYVQNFSIEIRRYSCCMQITGRIAHKADRKGIV